MIRIAVMILLMLPRASAAAETLLERGDYLVNAVMGCDGCHTPRTPAGFVLEKRFAGGTVLFDLPAYTVRGSNITPDRETGIGEWSADDLKRALIDGVRPNGVPLAPSMPFAFYKILTPRDLDAVTAYVRSVAPIRNEIQTPNYKAEMHTDLVPGAGHSIGNEVPTDPVTRGMYLATLAHCMECYARRPDNRQDYQGWWGKGGAEMKGPWGQVIVRNISSHKEKGVGAWTDDEIKRALTHGVGRDGRAFKLPMARQAYYSKLTAADLDALVAWVRTIPPID
jgi:hypothetical protein